MTTQRLLLLAAIGATILYLKNAGAATGIAAKSLGLSVPKNPSITPPARMPWDYTAPEKPIIVPPPPGSFTPLTFG